MADSRNLVLSVLGSGRVAGTLASLWVQAGISVVALGARNTRRAQALLRRMSSTARKGETFPRVESNFQGLVECCNCLILCVSDDALEEVVHELAQLETDWNGRVVLHTSGVHSSVLLEPLAALGAFTGSLHPLQTIPNVEAGLKRVPGSSFAVDGAPKALRTARSLVQSIGGTPLRVGPDSRDLYHTSAVLASNGVVALVDTALELMKEAGFTELQARRALMPLIQGTVENLNDLVPSKAITGPVARGDAKTVARHLGALGKVRGAKKRKSLLNVYAVLAQRILAMVQGRSGRTSGARRIAQMLLELGKK